MISRDQVEADILPLLADLADDWEYSGEIEMGTRMFSDLGFESLDVVVLGTSIQELYDRVLPFHEFFAEVGQRQQPDITVEEWINFIHQSLNAASAPTLAGKATA